ncbi:MAG: hypothetical protein WC522_00390 [Candidatus Omnitrophota bacterium]
MKTIGKILIGILLGIIFSFFPGGFLVFSVFLSVLYFMNRYLNTPSKDLLIKLFMLGFAVRVIMAFVNYYVAVDVMHDGVDTQPDAVIYNNNAYYIANHLKPFDNYSEDITRDQRLKLSMERAKKWQGNRIPPVGSYQNGFYVFVIGLFYSWLGYCPIAAKVMNCIFGCGCAVLTYFIAKHLSGSETIAKASYVVTMFFPSLMLWSATLLRDSIANFLFLAYMLSCLLYLKFGRNRALPAAFAMIVLLALFRLKIEPILTAGLGIVIIAGLLKKFFPAKRLTVFFAVIFILIISAVMIGKNIDFVTNQVNSKIVLAFKHHQAYSTHDVASVYKIFKGDLYGKANMNIRDFLDVSLCFSMLKGLAYYFLSPFPWRIPWNHFWLLIFYPQVIVTFIFLPFIALGLLVSARRDIYVTAVMLTVLAIVILPNVFSEGVIGIVVRHRDMFTPFLIIFASYGFYSLMLPKKHPEDVYPIGRDAR